MREQVKHRANAAYKWIGENPATAILVSGGISAGLTVLLVAALGLYSSATYVQKSACTKNPASRECAELRQAVARAEPIKNPCISFQRVTNRRGENCPERFVPRRHGSAAATSHRESVPDQVQTSPQIGSPDHQPPGTHGGGGTGKGGVGQGGSGGGQGPAPSPGHQGGHQEGHSGGSESPPKSPHASSQAESAASPKDTTPDIPATVEATGKAAGEAVEKTGEAVQGTVEGAGDAGCKVLGKC